MAKNGNPEIKFTQGTAIRAIFLVVVFIYWMIMGVIDTPDIYMGESVFWFFVKWLIIWVIVFFIIEGVAAMINELFAEPPVYNIPAKYIPQSQKNKVRIVQKNTTTPKKKVEPPRYLNRISKTNSNKVK